MKRKYLKKIAIIFSALFVLFLAAAFILPLIFEDDIKKVINKEIEKTINAQVYFDSNSFKLSFFKNFPDLTLSLNDFGIVGKEDFEQDTLVNVSNFSITIDLWRLLEGIEVKEIAIDKAQINIKVLKNGKANYDITYPDTAHAEIKIQKEIAEESHKKTKKQYIQNSH